MKFLFCALSVFAFSVLSAQVPDFKFETIYGLGFANYSEEGILRPIQSDWSAWAGDLRLEAQGRIGMTYPYWSARLIASETDTESWREDGRVMQKNDMSMAGIDFALGLKVPMEKQWGTLTPSLGLVAGYKSYSRENFVLFYREDTLFPPWEVVTEDVETYGVGGGVALEFPLGEQWVWGAETSAYWLFYAYAENDGFNVGIEGDEGISWISSLWIAKNLKNSGQILGMKLLADAQWIEGGDNLIENADIAVEWPDSEWQYFSLALFWRGEF